MSEAILKSGALALGLLAASASFAQASELVFDNADCLFLNSCDLTITGPGSANGAVATLSSAVTAFQFSTNAHGLGLGYIGGNTPDVSDFPELITFSVDRDLTWIGGAFAAVETNSDTTPAVEIFGPGVMTTVFGAEADFNARPVSSTTVSSDYEVSVSFLANEDYTFRFAGFEDAGDNNDAYVQLRSMEFVATSSIPLPATAWMMISALGFLGWRKYRAA